MILKLTGDWSEKRANILPSSMLYIILKMSIAKSENEQLLVHGLF